MGLTFETFPLCPGIMVNIDLARQLVAGRPPNARWHVPTGHKIVQRGLVAINKKHLANGKLKVEPVLMIRVGIHRALIDGWHRTEKAHQQGRTWLQAHLLTNDDLCKITWNALSLKPTS